MGRFPISIITLAILSITAHSQTLDPTLHHLRHGQQREWDEFPDTAEGNELKLSFDAKANTTEKTLRLRHRDLRHVWKVMLNGKDLVKLPQEDNATLSLIEVPAHALHDGKNDLQIVCTEKGPEPDDIEVGDIALLDQPRKQLLAQATIDIAVIDTASSKLLPCRLTILDPRDALVPLGIESDADLAVRTGVAYTATGRAKLSLPTGQYTLYAGRGFEWGIDSVKLDLKPGENQAKHLAIRREVNTTGYVASDTHIHTYTFSRHGDATLAERMITLAGEAIELPVATDHNMTIDYEEAAKSAGVRAFFTPVIGNEVTTPKLGHFNVFPLDKTAPLIDFRAPTWAKLFANIDSLAPGAVLILNHARDDHGGFRPFDPARHISLTGENLDGQVLRANAMEVINSGATLNDPLLLYRDWMGCQNRGLRLTPIGASDSHDVTRFIVGQGRTYVQTDDKDPGNIHVGHSIEAMKSGHVLVSYGLLVHMKIDGRFDPGDLAATDGEINVEIDVQGPSWTRAGHVELYANGIKIRESAIDPENSTRAGRKAHLVWKLPKFSYDVFLSAIATGPGVTAPYWPGAKPYQRTSSHWIPYVLGCTGAIYLDADGSGKFESAFDYATRIVNAAKNDIPQTVKMLERHDAAVAAQAASLLRMRGKVTAPTDLENIAESGAPAVRTGFEEYAKAWRQSEEARAAKSPPK